MSLPPLPPHPFVVFLVGLEGSGKSELAQALRKAHPPCEEFSDCLRSHTGESLQYSEDFQSLLAALSSGRSVVLNDVSWCDPAHLRAAQEEMARLAPRHRQRTVYFENDVKRCVANLEARRKTQFWRDADSDTRSARAHSRTYRVPELLPENSSVCPVWRPR